MDLDQWCTHQPLEGPRRSSDCLEAGGACRMTGRRELLVSPRNSRGHPPRSLLAVRVAARPRFRDHFLFFDGRISGRTEPSVLYTLWCCCVYSCAQGTGNTPKYRTYPSRKMSLQPLGCRQLDDGRESTAVGHAWPKTCRSLQGSPDKRRTPKSATLRRGQRSTG